MNDELAIDCYLDQLAEDEILSNAKSILSAPMDSDSDKLWNAFITATFSL